MTKALLRLAEARAFFATKVQQPRSRHSLRVGLEPVDDLLSRGGAGDSIFPSGHSKEAPLAPTVTYIGERFFCKAVLYSADWVERPGTSIVIESNSVSSVGIKKPIRVLLRTCFSKLLLMSPGIRDGQADGERCCCYKQP